MDRRGNKKEGSDARGDERVMLCAVRVPKQFEQIFQKAQEYVGKYFKEKKETPSKGTIEIFGERYILVRAASMSIDFFEIIKDLYRDRGAEEAHNVARQFLFDIAHAIGKQDAKNFHNKMKLKDSIEKLSAGPIHFAYSGWAFVDIFPESRPTPDENYYLIYDHPFSFESDAWEREGKKSDFPVCVMNAGYSSGWCEESFGVSLVASEILCRAKGDDVCRFIMAHPSKMDDYIKDYLKKEPKLAKRIIKYEIPGFFKRKEMEEALRKAYGELEQRVKERTARLAETTEQLKQELTDRKRAEEELKKHRDHLEHLVNKRTAKLTQANRKLRTEIAERKKIAEKLYTLSVRDELTGLYNRRGFFTLVEQQLKLAERLKRRIFLLYIDLDNLKEINDTFSHQEGDLALIEIAKILKKTFRESDIIARIGGDEFVAVPARNNGCTTETTTARLQKNLEVCTSERNRKYKLSISIGIAFYNPESPCSIDALLLQAEKSMYEQKMHKKKS